MDSLKLIETWPVDNAAAAVVTADGQVAGAHGDIDRVFSLASVTKLLTAYAALIAIEEGVVELDTPAGPEGSTVRHLLAHTSGLAIDQPTSVATVGAKRVYSSAGFDVLADVLAKASGIPFPTYEREGMLEPLGMTATNVDGTAGAGAASTVNDLVLFAGEIQLPTLLHEETWRAATSVQFPGLTGVLPGFGHQKPNDWGLGFEIRGNKSPHWTGTTSSPRSFGHFGQSGTFLWVDPDAGAACVAMTDRDFGPWAAEAWPQFTDAVLAELAS